MAGSDEALIKCAERAMYLAKESGCNNFKPNVDYMIQREAEKIGLT